VLVPDSCFPGSLDHCRATLLSRRDDDEDQVQESEHTRFYHLDHSGFFDGARQDLADEFINDWPDGVVMDIR
jgi:hypothetical protein